MSSPASRPVSATMCTSVMKDPSTVIAPLWSVKEESCAVEAVLRACHLPEGVVRPCAGPHASILMLTAKPGAEWKLYVALWRATRGREYGLRGSFPTQCALARCVRESQHGRHGQSAGGGP